MNYAYVRVSTGGQTVENQKFAIKENGYQIDEWFEDTEHGTIDFRKRKLIKVLKKMQKGDLLVCTELSRLGRSIYMIMEILKIISEKECSLVTIKENFKLDNSISSKVISFAFSLVAEIERNLLSQRVKEALARLRAEGKHLGRPFNARNKAYALDKYRDKIIKWRGEKRTTYYIAKHCKTNYRTAANYIARFGL